MRTFSSTRPPAKRTRASILVHGLTGTGKTTRALKEGKPLVICTEPKAEAHVLKLNPAATCWVPESCADLEKIFEWLGDPKLADAAFTRIVLDSYTELTEMLPDWILRKQAQDAVLELGRRIDIGEYRPVQQWGIGLIRAIQLSGLPSIIIARSDAKEQGRVQKIVPAGLGSSARNLNAQLVPTVEARFDEELQLFIWDSRPDEYSQRCGLLWVPPVWTGTADEFLAAVENGEQMPKDAPAEPTPLSAPTEPLANQAPEPKTVGEAFAQLPPPAKTEPGPQAEDFVDGMANGSASPTFISQEEWGTLEDLLLNHKIDKVSFLRFCEAEKHIVPTGAGEIRLGRMTKKSFDKLEPILATERRRNGLVTYIKSKYSNPAQASFPLSA